MVFGGVAIIFTLRPRCSSLAELGAVCALFVGFAHTRMLMVVLLAASAAGMMVAPRPAPTTVMIASADTPHSFQLVSLALNASSLMAEATPLGDAVPGWVMLQGDASAFDAASGVYYATLSLVSDMYATTALYGFNASSGAVAFQHMFPANFSMGMLAWDAAQEVVVGMCGSILTGFTGVPMSYCAFDPVSKELTLLRVFHPVDNNTYYYDPDTRALDAQAGLYYARLYTEPRGEWMPDNIVTLNASTGETVHAVYGGGTYPLRRAVATRHATRHATPRTSLDKGRAAHLGTRLATPHATPRATRHAATIRNNAPDAARTPRRTIPHARRPIHACMHAQAPSTPELGSTPRRARCGRAATRAEASTCVWSTPSAEARPARARGCLRSTERRSSRPRRRSWTVRGSGASSPPASTAGRC